MKQSLRPKLPEYAFPRYWVSLPELPTKGGESRKSYQTGELQADSLRTPAGSWAASWTSCLCPCLLLLVGS